MLDWLKKLFSEPTTLGIIFSSAIVGLVSGSAAGVSQYRNTGIHGVVRSCLIGIMVGIIVGLGIADYVQSETAKLAIVGAMAAIGEDIFEGLKSFGKGVRTDPLGYVARMIDAFRGIHRAEPPKQDQEKQ